MKARLKQRFFSDAGLMVHHADGAIERVDGLPLTDADRKSIAQAKLTPKTVAKPAIRVTSANPPR